jgi:hypothetical protein
LSAFKKGASINIGMEEKKSNKPFIAITAVGGLAAAALLYSGITNPVPQKEYAPRAPGEVTKIPKEQPKETTQTIKGQMVDGQEMPLGPSDIGLELYVSQQDKNLVERVGLSIGAKVRVDWAVHAPVFYDVPGVLYGPVELPVGNPLFSGFTLTLPKPQSLDGKVLVVYGRDRATREQKRLYHAVLNMGK